MSPDKAQKQSSKDMDVQTVWMRRLKDLSTEYENLEHTEQRLLAMLEKVRREEGYLLQALNDDDITDQVAIAVPTPPSPPPKQKYSMPQQKPQNPEKEQTPDTSSGDVRAQRETQPAEAAATIETQAIPTRRKRRKVQSITQKPTARNIEANRHAQRREERVLARQRLENALFADDDDSSSSSS